MNSLIKKVTLAAVLGSTVLVAAAPAEAQRYRGRGGYDRGYRHNNGGTAVVAGIAGLAIGAALASNRNDRYRDGYYRDRGYNGYYTDGYSNRGYYNDGYRDRGYYNDGYRSSGYGGYRGCRTEWRYDRYYDQQVRVRVCR